jgi:hypothetical protein
MIWVEIDRKKVFNVLEVQRGRDASERGMEPEMILSCFYGLNRTDTAFCEECRNYEGCYPTLKIGIVERKPFERS